MNDNNFSGKYRILKKSYQKINKILKMNNVINLILFIVSISAILFSTILVIKNNNLEKENKKLFEENLQFTQTISMYVDASLYFADSSLQLEKNNQELQSLYNEALEELEFYYEREELHNDYEWAMYDRKGKKNDISFDQITTLKEYCDEKGYSNDMVNIVLALAMSESGGYEDAYNPSTATGYCQLLDSTARFVYTKLQGHESYSHDVSLDGDTNLAMCADYINYLYDYYHHDMSKVIDSYRGLHSEEYIAKINRYLSNNNLSIDQIKIK